MSKVRWAQWFWADWSNDSALNLCSLGARGTWMACLCLMAQGQPYGTLTIKGRVPSADELFDLIAPRGTRRRDFNRWLAELEGNGVAQRDHRLALVSPRMSHEGVIARARIVAAQHRWETQGTSQSSDNLHMQSGDNGACLHKQTTTFASHDSSHTQSLKDSPSPTPTPASGGGASRVDLLSVVQNASRSRPVPAGGAPHPPFRIVAGADR